MEAGGGRAMSVMAPCVSWVHEAGGRHDYMGRWAEPSFFPGFTAMSSIVSWRAGYGLACRSALSRRRTRLLLGWEYHGLGAPDELETAP